MMRNMRSKKTCVLAAAIALMTMLAFSAPPAFADAGSASVSVMDHPDGNIVMAVDGSSVKAGKGKDGFNKDFTCLTQTQLDSISSESSADVFFSSDKYDSYMTDVTYSALRRNNESAGLFVSTGLSLRAVADSLGVDTSKSPAFMYYANDGYSSSWEDIWQTRYDFEDSGTVEVQPCLALSGKYLDAFASHSANDPLDTPIVLAGQTTTQDYNGFHLGRYTRELVFGKAKSVLSLKLATGETLSLPISAVISRSGIKDNIGRQQATYTYSDNTGTHTYKASGVTLGRLLSYYGAKYSGYTMTASGTNGKKMTIDTSSVDKYFIAYEGTKDGSEITSANADLVLAKLGSDDTLSVMNGVTGITIAPNKCVITKTKKKSGTSAYARWKSVSGVKGYQFAYSTSKKFSKSKTKTVNISKSKTSVTVKHLKSGKRYYCKVRAKSGTSGNTRYGAWSAVRMLRK